MPHHHDSAHRLADRCPARTVPCGLATLALLVLTALLPASVVSQETPTTEKTIDPGLFLSLTTEAFEARSERLLSIEDFLVLSRRQDVVLLDTRSAAAFEQLHLEGAVHLNFSDLTGRSLERTVGDPSRTILIYCNNNFTSNEDPFPTKLPPAALNLPTFATLWAYGYRHVYELGDLLDVNDPRITLEGSAARRVADGGSRY